MEACGTERDKWGFDRVDEYIQKEIKESTTLVLPLATIIKTGNHISQASGKRYELAQALAKIMTNAADEQSPWAAFTDQSVLWKTENLKKLVSEWPKLALEQISIGMPQ